MKQRRAKRQSANKWLLMHYKDADEAVYREILEQCTQAVIMCSERVTLNIPYFVEFSEGFPGKRIEARLDKTNLYSVRADQMLDYLHKIGKSVYSGAMLREAVKTYDKFVEKVDGMLHE